MTFSLPQEAVAWSNKAKAFVEGELKPYEIEAEMNGGRIPEAARKAHEKACRQAAIVCLASSSE